MSKRATAIYLIVLAYAQFVILGMPAGFMGAAWLSIKTDFNLPLDAVGLYLLANTACYTLSSFFNGQITHRLGFGWSLVLAAGLNLVGLAGMALSPTWEVVIGSGLVVGLAGGIIDAGLNRFLAARERAMLINWLHAFYGVGATLGPFVFSLLKSNAINWRVGYLVALAVQLVLGLLILGSRRMWEESQAGTATAELIRPAEKVSLLETLRLPVVWLALAGFIVYCGAEGSAGQWATSLFTLQRGLPEATASFWTGLYWASFTIGRLALGWVVDHFGIVRSLRVGIILAGIGAVLLWLSPVNEGSFLGLALMGFAFAPYFATMIAYTPRLVGQRQAANVIGMQVGAGSLGIALLPWLGGVLASSALGIQAIGPFLLVLVLLLLLIFELLVGRDWLAAQAPAAVAGEEI